jgi:predicted ATPase
MTKRQSLADREELRIALAALFMHAEISNATTACLDDNSELASRGLRRADMLLQLHEQSVNGR